MMVNDLVREIWMSGQITAEQMLSLSYYPGSEQLLQAIRANTQAAQQGANPQGIPQDLMSGVTGQANQDVVRQADAALRA